MGKKTVLFEQHQQAGAKIVDFAGWDLPLHYGSQLEEHQVVRHDAGVFDVSHMTIIDVIGVGAREYLRYLLANDVDNLNHIGKALYSCMLNDRGGVIDDLIVYLLGADVYRVVVNSATREKDIAWMEEQAKNFSVGLQERSQLAMLAVQGPQARTKLFQVLSPSKMDAVSTLAMFEGCEVEGWFIARTGYTGEDGFEIMLPNDEVKEFWHALLAAGIKPCGLGARDTLRLEAGMHLYGQDMDEQVTPLESNLTSTVAFKPTNREFIGRSALENLLTHGAQQKLIGLVLVDKGVLRRGQSIIVNDQVVGIITSGTYSPTLQKSIAFARVGAQVNNEVLVEIRGKKLTAKVVKPRFVRYGKSLI